MRITEKCKIVSALDFTWKAHTQISIFINEINTAFSELPYSCSNIYSFQKEVIFVLNLEGNILLGNEEK